MQSTDLLALIREKNIQIKLQDGQIKINAPKGKVDAFILNEIKNNKTEIISILQQGENTGASSAIKRAEVKEYYPLSSPQMRMFLLHQLDPQSTAYNEWQYKIIDAQWQSKIENAFRTLIDRHESLRTKFRLVDSTPVQVVCKKWEFSLEKKKSTGFCVEDEVKDFVRPFDLESGPLLRARVVETNEGHYLFMDIHHIVFDGASGIILRSEFDKVLSNEHVPALQLQYKDYSEWQRNYLKTSAYINHEQYWLNKMSGTLPVLDVIPDFPRVSAQQDYDGGILSFSFDAELKKKLDKICLDKQSTLFVTLLAVYNVLLFKYTAQNDIIVGTVVSGRSHADLEHVIGMFVNTLALRNSPEGEKSFLSFMNEVRSTSLEAFQHQEYQFERLIEKLGVRRDTSRNPIFDTVLTINKEKDASLEPIPDVVTSKFDLGFSFIDTVKELHLQIVFSKSIFKASTVKRMGEHFTCILTQIVNNPEIQLKDIDLITDEERHVITNVFNNTTEPFPENETLVSLFEKQVTKSPEGIAIIDLAKNWTYAELNTYVNTVANSLRKDHFIATHDIVAVCMYPSFEMYVTLLGILKAGGSYLPIDPDFPLERVQYLLADGNPKRMIVNKRDEIALTIPEDAIVKIEWDDLAAIGKEAGYSENPMVGIASNDVACILYTSGSTGKPKGVLVQHQGLINRLHWLWNKLHFTNEDIYVQKTSYTFDVSIGEIFMTLCYGAKLLVCSREALGNPYQLVNHIDAAKATTVHFSPTNLNSLHTLLQDSDYKKLKSLRHILSSGEALLPETVRAHYNKCSIPLYNLYGPTEASIEVSYYKTNPGDAIIPIGKPISNVQLYILDPSNHVLPIGIPGEICIGGVAVAKGYLNKEAETQSRFIEVNLGGNQRHRLYKTGDIGRWTETGSIEFLGRRDNQTSIGGYRIELGEIESALNEHEQVRNAVAITHKDQGGISSLVAYIEKTEKQKQADTGHSDPPPNHTHGTTSYDPQIIEDANKTDAAYRLHTSFHVSFEELVEKYATREAVVYESRKLTYSELNQQANQLARFMMSNYAIKHGDIVGLLLERTEKMIVTILAIMKAGAVYVPIDSEYPDDRIKYILSNSHVKLVLTDVKKIPTLDVPILDIRNAATQLAQQDGTNLESVTQSNDLAYIIYTSGSTGMPKGVMVEHKNVLNVAEAYRDLYALDTFPVRLLQMASISFDVFVGDMCRALLNGGQLVICPSDVRIDPEELSNLLVKREITIFESTPALIVPLMDYVFSNKVQLPHLKILVLGSDTISLTEFKKLLGRFGDIMQVYNSYGTTETTIDSSSFLVKGNEFPICVNTPIGKPIRNTKFYILDDMKKPVEVGAVGELYISGDGVARGYASNETQTKERFLSDPFEKGKRMYKTGDLARWLPDGNVEFLGRNDRQVKIRGLRLELGEIENMMLGCLDISNVIVKPYSTNEDGMSLCAYYVSASKIETKAIRSYLQEKVPKYMIPSLFVHLHALPLTANGKIDYNALPLPVDAESNINLSRELRKFLQKKLPSYMIPSTFVMLDKFPMTVSGKIDRKALPKPEVDDHMTDAELVLPRTELEKKIMVIWQDVLNIKSIGINQDFFELGGHSLKAMIMLSRIFKELDARIDLRVIFKSSTIESLAQEVQAVHGARVLIEESELVDKNQFDVVEL